MVNRSHLVELLSEAVSLKGTAFFDIGNGGKWITPSGVFFIESHQDQAAVYAAFVKHLLKGRNGEYYEQLVKSPVVSVSRMVDSQKLAIVVSTGKQTIVVSASDRPKFSSYQVGWIESRFLVEQDSDLLYANSVNTLSSAIPVPASYTIYHQGHKPETLRPKK